MEFRYNDVVGVKGRLETKDNNVIVVAEKISFLTSNTKDGE